MAGPWSWSDGAVLDWRSPRLCLAGCRLVGAGPGVLVVRRYNLENAMERSMRGLRAAQPAAAPRYCAHGVGASFGTSEVVRRVELGSVGLSDRSRWASVGSLIWPRKPNSS